MTFLPESAQRSNNLCLQTLTRANGHRRPTRPAFSAGSVRNANRLDWFYEAGRQGKVRAGFYPARCSEITFHSLSAVAGISKWRTPSGDNASLIAFMIAGRAPTVPASPAPLTPRAFCLVGTLWLMHRETGRLSARGM